MTISASLITLIAYALHGLLAVYVVVTAVDMALDRRMKRRGVRKTATGCGDRTRQAAGKNTEKSNSPSGIGRTNEPIVGMSSRDRGPGSRQKRTWKTVFRPMVSGSQVVSLVAFDAPENQLDTDNTSLISKRRK